MEPVAEEPREIRILRAAMEDGRWVQGTAHIATAITQLVGSDAETAEIEPYFRAFVTTLNEHLVNIPADELSFCMEFVMGTRLVGRLKEGMENLPQAERDDLFRRRLHHVLDQMKDRLEQGGWEFLDVAARQWNFAGIEVELPRENHGASELGENTLPSVPS